MGPTAKAGLILAMIALLFAGQLVEREFRKRREAARAERRAALSAYDELLAPLAEPGLPRVRAGGGPAAGGGAAPASGTPVEGKVYVIQAGDTLAKIARKVYGSEAAWTAILERNRSAIANPAKLRVGATLLIPPRPKPPAAAPR